MSATHGASALTVVILIALSGPAATQETGAPLDVANVSAAASAFAQQEFRGTPSSAARVAPLSFGEISHNPLGLSENSFDFTNPDSIPGFGTLPKGYDARPVLPRFSGE